MIIAALIVIAVICACKKEEQATPFSGIENLNADVSYAMGMSIGVELLNNLMSGGLYPNIDEFIKGMSDMMKGSNPRIDVNSAAEIIDAAFNSIMEERTAAAAQTERDFLTENAKRLGVNVTSSGLQYEVITEGNGPKPASTDIVRVHYEGTFVDGTVFDSSLQHGEPAELNLSSVITGWTEGIQLMSIGSQYIFYIPSALGYGDMGYQNPWTGETLIPGYSTLIFIVELLDIIHDTGE